MNYHYSSLLHLPFILLSEALKASRRDAHGDHRAGLLWFSTNPVIERTAIKQSAPPIRFACSLDTIRPWQAVARSVGFSSAVMRRLERSGRQMGAVPSQWRAMVGGVPLAAASSIEIFYAGGWHGVERAALQVEGLEGGAVRLLGPGGPVAMVLRRKTREGYYAYATDTASCHVENLLPQAWREVG